MKRLARLISIILLFVLLPLIANAAESSSRLLPLKSQALVTVLQHSDYKDRNFYQSSARETSDNTSSEQALERMTAYSIVACRDDRIASYSSSHSISVVACKIFPTSFSTSRSIISSCSFVFRPTSLSEYDSSSKA